jgi:hypothetical protein
MRQRRAAALSRSDASANASNPATSKTGAVHPVLASGGVVATVGPAAITGAVVAGALVVVVSVAATTGDHTPLVRRTA